MASRRRQAGRGKKRDNDGVIKKREDETKSGGVETKVLGDSVRTGKLQVSVWEAEELGEGVGSVGKN